MILASDSRRPAFLCALLLLLYPIATLPVAESGINDDWPYVQSVRILAQTGHTVYNGWSAPILGWQLFLGALFVKVFGPSFTAIRASTLLVALFTAFLTHRALVRAGVNPRNATVGTLVLVLSPIFLQLLSLFLSGALSLLPILVAFTSKVSLRNQRAVEFLARSLLLLSAKEAASRT